jgi:DNA-binding phage protein
MQITSDNLSQIAHAKGFRGVAGLARRLGRDRGTLYRAVRRPRRFGPTILAMRKALFNE